MRLGKNKKKQWRRCAPGIEDEIIKSNQLKEIDEASFEVTGKVKSKELKYSTVPRIITRKIRKFVKEEAIDLWADDNNAPKFISKRHKQNMENKAKYVKPEEIIHPGTSWFPVRSEHKDLLKMLEKDENARITEEKKFSMRKKVVEEEEEEEKPNTIETGKEELEMEQSINPMIINEKRKKIVTSKERKRKSMRMNLEKEKQKEREKQKEEAHGLRNIPKLCKQIKRTREEQKKKLEAANELRKKKEADKIFRDQIYRMPFQLESELAPNLRSMQTEGDLLRELCDTRAKMHKFKSEKPKKMKKLTKMVKKKGIV